MAEKQGYKSHQRKDNAIAERDTEKVKVKLEKKANEIKDDLFQKKAEQTEEKEEIIKEIDKSKGEVP